MTNKPLIAGQITENALSANIGTPRHLHEQAKSAWCGFDVWVDAGLVDLLEALWEHGYDTQASCQGGSACGAQSLAGTAEASMFGRDLSDAMIVFATYGHAAAFLSETIAMLGYPDGYHNRLYCREMALMAATPIPDPGISGPDRWNGPLRGTVRWVYDLTGQITQAWQDYEPDTPQSS